MIKKTPCHKVFLTNVAAKKLLSKAVLTHKQGIHLPNTHDFLGARKFNKMSKNIFDIILKEPSKGTVLCCQCFRQKICSCRHICGECYFYHLTPMTIATFNFSYL
jgi:hypothetical protein